MKKEDIKFASEKLKINLETINTWKDKLKIFKYGIGESILDINYIQKEIFLILDGKVRLRGVSNKKNKKIFSIGILEPFEFIGKTSIEIKSANEIASAATDCILLSIPYEFWDDFYNEIIKDNNSRFLSIFYTKKPRDIINL